MRDASPNVGYQVVKPTIDDLMRSVIEQALDVGERVVPSKGPALDLTGASLVLLNPRARLSRSEMRGRATSAIAEFCWYASGSADLEQIAHYLGEYRASAESDGSLRGAYGPRIFDQEASQVSRVTELLRRNPASRQAVIQILRQQDLESGQRDVPCTIALQFVVRSGDLSLVTYMRSNDILWGLPHDIFAFTMIQELVARELGLELGPYVHMVGSLHLYERSIDQARVFLNEGYQPTQETMPPMPEGSPWRDLGELIRAEADLRSGRTVSEVELPASPYWSDIATLLAVHRALSDGRDELVPSLTAAMHDPFYRLYVEDRLDRRRSSE